MKKIEMHVTNISPGIEREEAYVMTLTEVNGDRMLRIHIGASEAQSMILELRGIMPPRPMTHNLFASVLEVLGVRLTQVLIYKVSNSIYYAYIFLQTNNSILRVDARTSDAVTMALRMRAPILVYESILEDEQSYIEDLLKTDEQRWQMESLSTLQATLQKAVENEEYELAARLRDIIQERTAP